MNPTLVQLIDLLPIVQGQGWRVTSDGYIRNSEKKCPMVALREEIFGEYSGAPVAAWSALAFILGYRCATTMPWDMHKVVDEFVSIADNEAGALRKIMMRNLGMDVS